MVLVLKLKPARCDRYSPALAWLAWMTQFLIRLLLAEQLPSSDQSVSILDCLGIGLVLCRAIAFKFSITTNLVSKKAYKTAELAKLGPLQGVLRHERWASLQ